MKMIILTVLGLVLMSCAVKAGGQGQVEKKALPEGLMIITDQQTKCQYIITSGHYAMVPRLGRGGRPLCELTGVQ